MSVHKIDWEQLIPDEEWQCYRPAVVALTEADVPFALGGGFAFSALSGRLRNTKDMDLFILPADRDRAVQAVTRAGFVDFYAQEPYDRGWIYRGFHDGLILDLIWQMANYRAEVDERWLTDGPCTEWRGLPLRVIPPEELVWAKLYVVQRGRCDWPDLLSVLQAQGETMDWKHLIQRVGPDLPLLASLVKLFSWLVPDTARHLPDWLWKRLEISPPVPADRKRRIDLLDSRDWFGPSEVA